ncbi:hypothetical protein L1887_29221 [Cichorium endivia]|nr:hypothetical protein L1887_29221 [Cichorium endivia]
MQRLFGLSMTLNPVVSIVCLIVSGTGMIRPHQIVRSNHTTRFSQSYWWPRCRWNCATWNPGVFDDSIE